MKHTKVPAVAGGAVEIALPSDSDILAPFLRMLRVSLLSASGGQSLSGTLCLTAVGLNDGCTHHDIAEATQLPKYTVSKALRALEDHGYVTQGRTGENRREVRVHLTARGKQVKARVLDEARAAVKQTRARQLMEARRGRPQGA